ncbi:fimbrial protein [Salmonella enterica]
MSGQMTYLKTTLMVLAMMAGAAALPVQAGIANCNISSPPLTIPDINLSSTTWVANQPVGTSQVTIAFNCYIGPPTDSADRYYATLAVNENFREAIQALKSANLGLKLEITDGTGKTGTLSWDQIQKTGSGSDVKVSFGAKLDPTGKGDHTKRTATLTGTFIATEGNPPNVPVNIHVGPAVPAFEIRPVKSGTYDYNSFGTINTNAFDVRLFPSGTGKICISTTGPYACDVNQPTATVNFGHLYPTSVDSLTRTLPFWVKATQSVGTTTQDGFDVPLSVEFVSEGETLTSDNRGIIIGNGLVLSISGPDGQKVTFNQPAPMNISLHFAPSTWNTVSQQYTAKVEPASNQAEIKTGRFNAGVTVKVTYN